MLQEISTSIIAIIISLYFIVHVARNMVSMMQWQFPSSNRISELFVYIFVLMLQALISVLATVIYQYRNGPSDEKSLVGRPG